MTPEIKKQAVLTLYQQGQPYAEIAESLLMPKNTVKSICRRSGLKPLPMKDTDVAACKNCGKPLIEISGGRKRIFCCDQCRYAWWNHSRHKQPYILTCRQCGEKFISFGNKNRRYCGRDCYNLSRYGEGLP